MPGNKHAEIEESIPRFELQPDEVYRAMARVACQQGDECSWADLRLKDMKQHFPKREEIKDTATVRAAYLWYLAYQRQLVADLDSPHPEVRSVAAKEIERIAGQRAQPFDQVKGGRA